MKNYFPKYVRIDGAVGSALRLVYNGCLTDKSNNVVKHNVPIYYRDAGHWSIEFKNDGNRLFSKHDLIEHLNGKELIACTEDEYKSDNEGYC